MSDHIACADCKHLCPLSVVALMDDWKDRLSKQGISGQCAISEGFVRGNQWCDRAEVRSDGDIGAVVEAVEFAASVRDAVEGDRE